ncbi:MAG: hypothetical protein ACYDH6_22210 [Acidimicrobiales bacterium]
MTRRPTDIKTKSPLKVNAPTAKRNPYVAGQTDAAQAEVDGPIASESGARRVDEVNRGLQRAREVLAAGDVAIASLALDEPTDVVACISDPVRTQ